MRWIWSPGREDFVTPEEFYAEKAAGSKRAGFPTPHVISDHMEATLNHADGCKYTSKRGYEKAVKAAGCEIVGNDSSFKRPPKRKEYRPEGVAQDVKRAIDEVNSR